MPLSTKEKSARHRARINSDPDAREAYLAKRKESYQRRKREGKMMKPTISQLSKKERDKMRQQWRQDQRKHRERKKTMEEILNFTPESIEPPPKLEPNHSNIDDIVTVDTQRASS